MTPRRRSDANRGLPPRLYTNPLRYRDPITGRYTSLRRMSLAQAIAYAQERNRAHDAGERPRAADPHSIGTLLRRWLAEYATPRYRATTLSTRRILVDLYAREWGDVHIRYATRDVFAARWAQLTPAAYSTHRAMWVVVLRWVVALGILDANEADMTLRALPHRRQRDRLTLEQFEAIRAAAEPWFRRVLDVALCTGLRRADLVGLRRQDVRDGRLCVRTSKTTAALAFPVTPRLAAALAPLRTEDGVEILHRYILCLPGRHEPLNPDFHVTKHFARLARQVTQSEHPPTFHEIRSLGGRLLLEAGAQRQQVQAWYGHRKAATTELYLDDQRFALVEVGL